MAKRLQAMGQRNYQRGFEVTLHEHTLEVPMEWKKSQMIFVNSMSDPRPGCDSFLPNLSWAPCVALTSTVSIG
jgi:hypothetical protein